MTVIALAIVTGVGAMGLGSFDGPFGPATLQAEPQGRGGRGGPPAFEQIEEAPTDRAVPLHLETLQQYIRDMDEKGLATLRMLEGGRYNVNIRRIRDAETALVHPVTIDLWVILEGSGNITTGGKLVDGKIVGGETRPLKVGDVEFIPAGVPHGVSEVNGEIAWLNVRWDSNYPEE
jgi:mannose-6-phosphate isomerase-like protein (cupin superfamily)